MAINCNSKLRDILEDERAVAIIEEYKPGFTESDSLGPVMGMRLKTLISFPQSNFSDEQQAEICAKLDALDA